MELRQILERNSIERESETTEKNEVKRSRRGNGMVVVDRITIKGKYRGITVANFLTEHALLTLFQGSAASPLLR